MRRTSRRVLCALSLLPLVVVTAACGSSTKGAQPSASSGKGPVKVAFWGWNPAYDAAVKQFNATHTDVQISYEKVVSGSQGGYAKMFAAVKAGNAPCLAQVGYETLPSFLVEGALQDVTSDAAPYKGAFASGSWQQVTVGGQVYGIPVDMGPMALFYRTDLYKKFGITPETSWDQYAADAVKVHKADPKTWLTTFNPDDPWWFAGVAGQAGGNWFGTSSDAWQVSLTDPATSKVAGYWQGLIDKGAVKVEKSFTPDLYKEFGNGTLASYAGPVWYSSILSQNAAAAAGKWAVAPMPTWSNSTSGNDGGSSTAVLKGCTHVKEALEFANWMSTDSTALTGLVKGSGIYPAATQGDDLPVMTAGDPYFGNQKIFDVFKQSLAQAPSGWNWGPTMTQTSSDLTDAFGAATSGHTPLGAALGTVQDKTVAEMKSKGLAVTAG